MASWAAAAAAAVASASLVVPPLLPLPFGLSAKVTILVALAQSSIAESLCHRRSLGGLSFQARTLALLPRSPR